MTTINKAKSPFCIDDDGNIGYRGVYPKPKPASLVGYSIGFAKWHTQAFEKWYRSKVISDPKEGVVAVIGERTAPILINLSEVASTSHLLFKLLQMLDDGFCFEEVRETARTVFDLKKFYIPDSDEEWRDTWFNRMRLAWLALRGRA